MITDKDWKTPTPKGYLSIASLIFIITCLIVTVFSLLILILI